MAMKTKNNIKDIAAFFIIVFSSIVVGLIYYLHFSLPVEYRGELSIYEMLDAYIRQKLF